MKSLFVFSLLFLSLLSCKTAPDAIADMDLTVSGNSVTLSNTSKMCVSGNYDIDWGNGVKEHTGYLSVINRYALLPSDNSYTITLTVYNIDNKPSKISQKVTIKRGL
jgi:hypothetical protein